MTKIRVLGFVMVNRLGNKVGESSIWWIWFPFPKKIFSPNHFKGLVAKWLSCDIHLENHQSPSEQNKKKNQGMLRMFWREHESLFHGTSYGLLGSWWLP